MIFKVVYSKAMQFHSFGLISQLWRIFEDQTKMEIPIWDFAALNKLNKYFHGKTVKYPGPILRVTCPALGSNDLNLDQSGTSIQILLEPNAGHETLFFV